MSYLESTGMQRLKNKRIAYCSGWADLEARRAQQRVDAMIPLSDHLDFFELIELCKKLRPKHVYITHTPNPNVVQHYLSLEGISSSPFGIEVKEEF
jgi:putative mRNA 3-end processing factor